MDICNGCGSVKIGLGCPSCGKRLVEKLKKSTKGQKELEAYVRLLCGMKSKFENEEIEELKEEIKKLKEKVRQLEEVCWCMDKRTCICDGCNRRHAGEDCWEYIDYCKNPKCRLDGDDMLACFKCIDEYKFKHIEGCKYCEA